MYVQHKQDEDYFNVWDKYLAGLSSILIYGQFLLQKKAYLHFELGGGLETSTVDVFLACG